MAEGERDLDIPRQLSIPTSSPSPGASLVTTKEKQLAAVDGDCVRAVLKYTNDDGR